MFFRTKSFDAKDIPDLSGKVAIVTGGNKGIGYETTLHLALHKAKVYLAARSEANATKAIEKMKAHDPSIQIVFLPLDLANLKSVREAANQILQAEKTIDILVCNAGVVAQEMSLTEDGIEIDFQTNYLGLYEAKKELIEGHFYFIRLLLNAICQSDDGRIVMLSSNAHKAFSQKDMTFETLESVNKKRGYLKRYGTVISEPEFTLGQSKLAMVLFAQELASRISNRPIFVNAVHPGGVSTDMLRNIFRSYSRFGAWFYDWFSPLLFSVTPYKGALNSLYAAASPEVRAKNLRGKYLEPIAKISEVHKFAKDDQRQKALWKLSELLLNERVFKIPDI